MTLEKIEKVNFEYISFFKFKKIRPIFIYLKAKKQLLSLSNWEDATKIIFYSLYNEDKYKRIIDKYVDVPLFSTKEVYISTYVKFLNCDSCNYRSTPVRFSSKPKLLYVKTQKEKGFPYNNLLIIKTILKEYSLSNVPF